jgi:[glutamine synthetase] adenylyltransferase / [glutamine synthetase]-adenylyl-L-tyrosine phosphorylase
MSHFQIDSPDPLEEKAAEKWAAFSDAADEETPRLLEEKHLTGLARKVFSFSDFIFENCLRSPLLLKELVLSGDLSKSYPEYHYRNHVYQCLKKAPDDANIGNTLCRIRRREMIRIAWRDLAEWADLSETMENLSALADAFLQCALEVLSSRLSRIYGTPMSRQGTAQQLVVIGMGKLGARELNFSSDVDLVFAYPEPGNTTGGEKTLTNEEFFIRLSREYIGILGTTSPDGPLFRVDLRLRPYGENGPLVMSFDNMEDYYQHQGRDWERYAWIKARIVAGDYSAGQQLLERMKPFIYRRYIDYNMFESFREMKRRIERELMTKGIQGNIKNGPGGIREVEFFGQIFQLLRGGVMPKLQRRAIRVVLGELVRGNFIPNDTARKLSNAYEFLRNTENRLQEYSDRQTHVLPMDADGRQRTAAAMGFETWDAFKSELDIHRNFVHGQFQLLLSTDDEDEASSPSPGTATAEMQLENLWLSLEKREDSTDLLAGLGCSYPAEVLNLLSALHQDPVTQALNQEGRRRLDKLIPILLKQFNATRYSPKVLQDVLELVKTVQRRTTYLSLLVENPDAVSRLLEFSAASPWIITYLARHPVLLDDLLDHRTLYIPPTHAELTQDLLRRLNAIDTQDLEYQMDTLRIFKYANTLRVAAADITGALPLMKVSDHLSHIAGVVIDKVLDLSWEHLTEKHGIPICELSGEKLPRGFAVIAYGKLGGYELGYTSDLDLVFLHAGAQSETVGGNMPVDTGQFFARLGQRVIHLMTAHTSAGVLYETDVRLRPSGTGGILVCHIDAFEAYQMKDAWPWEHQALVRARAIWGDPALQKRFEQIRANVIALHREKSMLQQQVADMRQRMSRELGNRNPDLFDLKQGRGGMVDIEFLVQYIVLLMAREYSPLSAWTDNVRLIQSLAQCNLINDRTAHLLRAAYLAYRSCAHRLSLQDKPAVVPKETFQNLRQGITGLWRRVFGSA